MIPRDALVPRRHCFMGHPWRLAAPKGVGTARPLSSCPPALKRLHLSRVMRVRAVTLHDGLIQAPWHLLSAAELGRHLEPYARLARLDKPIGETCYPLLS